MTRERARNWHKSNQALVNQGSIIFWIQKSALKGWYAEQTGGRGRPPVYSRHAIFALLVIRVVFGCPFRQLQGHAYVAEGGTQLSRLYDHLQTCSHCQDPSC